jgi:hypothetical protein
MPLPLRRPRRLCRVAAGRRPAADAAAPGRAIPRDRGRGPLFPDALPVRRPALPARTAPFPSSLEVAGRDWPRRAGPRFDVDGDDYTAAAPLLPPARPPPRRAAGGGSSAMRASVGSGAPGCWPACSGSIGSRRRLPPPATCACRKPTCAVPVEQGPDCFFVFLLGI